MNPWLCTYISIACFTFGYLYGQETNKGKTTMGTIALAVIKALLWPVTFVVHSMVEAGP